MSKVKRRDPRAGKQQAPRLTEPRHLRNVAIDPMHYQVLADTADELGTTVMRVLDAVLTDWMKVNTRPMHKSEYEKEPSLPRRRRGRAA